MSKFFIAVTATVLAGSALLATGDVKAGGVQANSTAFCQAALPVFDTNLRKRPLAVVNEGTSDAFVTCSYPVDISTTGVYEVDAYLANHTGITKDVNCTLVDGYDNGTVTYIPKTTRSYDDGGFHDADFTSAADNGGVDFGGTVGISCALPPGIGLADQYVSWN